MRQPYILAILGLVACYPQNAELVDGEYAAFISATRSLTTRRELLDYEKFDIPGKMIDCRPTDDRDTFPEEDREQICQGDDGAPNGRFPIHESWLKQDAFRVVGETLAPEDTWIGEAIITSENDFQVTFHHRLPGGEDLRWQFVIDPVFAPKACQKTAEDTFSYEPINGDWVENWSADLGEDAAGDRLFFLTGNSYQFNPKNPNGNEPNSNQFWALPRQWESGLAGGKFSEDLMSMRTDRYGMPATYGLADADDEVEVELTDLYYCPLAADSPTGNNALCDWRSFDNSEAGEAATTTNYATFGDLVNAVNDTRDGVIEEIQRTGVEFFEPRVHENRWRTPDGVASGLDGWVGLHYNWVRIDAGSNLEVGGSASGEYHLVLDGTDTGSRVLIRGTFNVDKIKKDRYVTADVNADKYEENQTEVCGQQFY
jgi:hypothetical protein